MARAKDKVVSNRPIIDGKVHPDVSQTIKFLWDNIDSLHAKVTGLDTSKVGHAELPAQLTKHAPVIRASLQAGGAAPLNATSLLGSLAQGQLTNVPDVPSLPLRNSPLSRDGRLIVKGGTLYRYDGKTNTWIAV